MKKILIGLSVLSLSYMAQAAQTTPVPDVAPAASGFQVVINVPQQRLFLYQNGKLRKVYPVGVGKSITQTTLGEHTIGAKAFNPTWHIPLSIQRERGDGVKTVPPGPKNPLGPVFVRLGNPKLGLGIHGTSNPSSVPGVVSHGCVRMKSPDALEFARTITSGSPAVVSYELAALNVDGGGNLWLAAFKDPYNKRSLPQNKLKQAINAWGQANGKTISPTLINQVLNKKLGTPVCLTCQASGKIQGDLHSLAWNSGSHERTLPKGGMSVRPQADEILPEGTAIEVEAAYDLDKFQGTSVFDSRPDEMTLPVPTTSVFETNGRMLKPLER
ncbi:MAG: L,D-transpeptidase [Alysiella sp.]|uniref:L,D-transpeptidase n=1 Tax=Alysiella sp. TaxID=1872483 RepID=UPI0026DDA2EE|nr:L,D-transpeptidase [Alysiella sp.]MDO4434525.1 L,D-transpeptidase [Alysiella sp.]